MLGLREDPTRNVSGVDIGGADDDPRIDSGGFPSGVARLRCLRNLGVDPGAHRGGQRHRDVLTPPAHGRELAEGILGAVHVCIPGAGHMLAQQAPHVVASAIDHVL